MTIRRTLNQALNKPALNDAAKAFVTGAAPKLRETTNLSGESDTPFDSLLPRGTVDEPVAMEKVREHQSAAEMDQQPPTGTVSMTFRLPSELSARLLRVSLDRKLRRSKPFSQQDIIAAALVLWFEKKGCTD